MQLVNTHKQTIIIVLLLFMFFKSNAQTWTMQQCIDTAQVNNKNIQISKNNIAIGEQREKETKANLIPKVTANAEYKYFTNLPYQLMPMSTFNPMAPEGQFKEAQFGVPHNINANLQLMMPLYNPQIYGAIQTTKVASQLMELQYKKTEEQLFFEITNLYYNAQILQHQLTFIDSNLVNAEKLYKNIQLLNQQLMAKGTDVSKVKLQVSQLTAQKENVKSKLDQVLNALKFAMGISIEQNLEVESNIIYQNTNEYTSSSTLDIQIVKTQNRLITNEFNTLNKSRFLPSLNFIALYGTTGFGYNEKPNDFLKFFPIGFAGVQFSYPLFNGTVTQRKLNQKKIELKNNELQSSLINDQNNLQIVNTKMQKNVAKKLVDTNIELIELTNTIYNQTILQQKQGTASLTDVLLADNALREAQQNYIATVIDYLKADLELKKITGNIQSNKKQ